MAKNRRSTAIAKLRRGGKTVTVRQDSLSKPSAIAIKSAKKPIIKKTQRIAIV